LNDKLLTPEDVAQLLGQTRQFVVRQTRKGQIPAIKIGKSWRYLDSSIKEWLRSQEQCAA
jgi:excisionase family DNA binding protein